MYRAAFVTPEMLLIECSMAQSPEMTKHGFASAAHQLRELNQTALAFVLRLTYTLCGLR
jgi:hypothetical protein